MRGAFAFGCAVLLALAGCGGSSAKPDASGIDAGVGGTGGGGTGGTDAAGDGSTGPHTVTLSTFDWLAFAAAQDGDGAWQAPTTLNAGQLYALEVTGARYGLAWGCASTAGDSITITVVQATVAETTAVTVTCGDVAPTNLATLSGAITGLSGTQTAQIDIGGRSFSVPAATPTYSQSVPVGFSDLFARRMTAPPMFDLLVRRRAVTVFPEGATLDLDFGTEGVAPDRGTVTYQGVAAGETTSLLVILRGNDPFALGSFPSGTYLGIPPVKQYPGDYHSVVASATDATAGVARRVRRLLTVATNFTAVMPPAPPAPVIAVEATTPYVRPRASIPAGFVSDRYDLAYNQSEASPARTRSWSLQLTRGWIAAAGASDYVVPDLASVAGFQTWWGLAAGATTWQQFANWSSAGVASLLSADQTVSVIDGREYKLTQRDGTTAF